MSTKTTTPHPARGALRGLLPAATCHPSMVLRTCVAAVAEHVALVALVTLSAYAVGVAVTDGSFLDMGVVVALVGLVLLRSLMTWREMDLSHDLAYRVLAVLRVRVFDGLARSAPARVAGRRSGDLAATAMGDVEALEFFYAHALAQLLAAGVAGIAGMAALATLEPWMLSAVLPAAALLCLAPLLDGWVRAAQGTRTREASAVLSAEAVETVDGLRELLSFNALDARRAQLRRHGRALGRAQRAEQSWEGVSAALREVIVVAAVAGVVLAAAQAVAAGRLHGAVAPAAVALSLGTLAPVAEAAAALGQAGGLRAAAARVGAAVRAPAGAPEPESPRTVPNGPLGLRLREVRFDYGAEPVLNGVDLTVRPGETIALVGVSGAGKSTCAHLAARFWDPTHGAVELLSQDGSDPVDVRELSESDLRRHVCVVGQEAPLFHGTLAQNLRLAAPHAPHHEVEAVARTCGIDALAKELERGLDTVVGERGATLSGGQRARIALGRALLCRPRVLVLDETTAHLDAASDAELAQALAADAQHRTTLLIAHRPATIRRADHIAVLEKGRIVERGSWRELEAAGSAFSRVVTSAPARS